MSIIVNKIRFLGSGFFLSSKMLKLDQISFAYNTQPVLEKISLEIEPGEHVALMGESGCGKSTLLKLIYGLISPGKGFSQAGELR